MVVREYGYEYDATPDAALWNQTGNRLLAQIAPNLLGLRSGRDALKIVAREHPNAVVLIPALSCASMCQPFTLYGLELRYYRLLENYAADINSVTAQICGDEECLLLVYMSYFGNCAWEDAALSALRQRYPQMRFVEDRTHTLLYPNESSFLPDYTVASLRKWTNVPDGGLLWHTVPLQHCDFGNDISFAEERLQAQGLRRQFFETGDESVKATYRAVFSTITDRIDADPLPCGMSEYAFRLAQKTDWQAIAEQRRANAATLMAVLRQGGVRLIQDSVGVSDLYVPFFAQKRDEIQRKLAAKGIFCTVIWPLSDQQKSACPTAKNTTEHMLAAPCDQRYTPEDMQMIGREIVRAFHE